jgi:hypothetical protein
MYLNYFSHQPAIAANRNVTYTMACFKHAASRMSDIIQLLLLHANDITSLRNLFIIQQTFKLNLNIYQTYTNFKSESVLILNQSSRLYVMHKNYVSPYHCSSKVHGTRSTAVTGSDGNDFRYTIKELRDSYAARRFF